MTTKLPSITSALETQEQADSYDRWFRSKVQTVLDDPRLGIPHNDAMEKLEEKRYLKAKRIMT